MSKARSLLVISIAATLATAACSSGQPVGGNPRSLPQSLTLTGAVSDSITSADWPGGNKSLGTMEAKTFNLPQDTTACYTFTDSQTGATWWYAELNGHLRGNRYPFNIVMSVHRVPVPGRHPFGLGPDPEADTSEGALVINERSLNTTQTRDQVSTFTVDPSMTSGTFDVVATDITDKTWTVKANGTWRCA